LNDISSQDKHLFEPTNSYHALVHDNIPNAIALFPTIVIDYGKKQVDDGHQMKDSLSPEKQM
jgi:hypothetical protein